MNADRYFDAPAWKQSAHDEIERLRRHLGEQPNCRFVSRPHFCKLLVSRSRLERSDDPTANVAGLNDCETGVRYFVECEKLSIDR